MCKSLPIKNISKCMVVVIALMLLVACSEAEPQKDILVGAWEVEGERNFKSVIFLEDGTVIYYENIDTTNILGQHNWKWVSEKKTLIIYGDENEPRQVEVNIIDSNNIVFTHERGNTNKLTRIK